MYYKQYAKVLLLVVALIATAALGYKVYAHLHPPEPVSSMSQHEAQTVHGVNEAAEKADVKLDNTQSKEVVEKIKYIYETHQEPVYIVETVGEKLPAVVEKEKEAVGADFAIVTDPKEPDKEINIEELPAESKVELNQYNIMAYKKVLHQFEIGRDVSSNNVIVGASVSKKVTEDGKYLGIGIQHETVSNKTYIKAIYTW